MLNVQFSDDTQAEIQMYFGAAQDPNIYPNLGTVDLTDARWKTFYDKIGGSFSGLPAPESDQSTPPSS